MDNLTVGGLPQGSAAPAAGDPVPEPSTWVTAAAGALLILAGRVSRRS
jgi:hypothetical protein